MPEDTDAGTQRGQGVTESWATVLRDVRSLAVDLTAASVGMTRLLPLPRFGEVTTRWSRVEETVLREIKSRLDRVEAEDRERRGVRPIGAAGGDTRTAAEMLDDLLTASIGADAASSREQLYRALLMHLVPDEARILAALADGTRYPLVHIQSRQNSGRIVLANASTVGRAAGLRMQDAVSTHVTRLRAIGLAEEGPADDSLAVQYDILLGEPGIREAEEAGDVGRLGTRVIKRTLRVSALGRQLWWACRPDEEVAPEPGEPGEPTAAEVPAADRAADAAGFQPKPAYQPSPNGVPANGQSSPGRG